MKNQLKKSESSYYLQLYDILKKEILSKKLQPLSKFYSMRQVGVKYNLNTNTVLRVYKMLEEEGYIYSIKGKGCFISPPHNFTVDERSKPVMENFKLGQELKEDMINFVNGTPSTNFFPIEEYRKLFFEISKDSHFLFGYQHVQGLPSLRKTLSEYMEKDDIFVNPDDIIITSGTQHSLALIAKAFGFFPKKSICVSAPSYPNVLNFFKNIHNIFPIDMEKDGWNLEQFESILKKEKIDLIYDTFNFQNPTGIVWSPEKRKKLLELADEYNFYIIEDDCFSEFYLDDTPISPLKSMDKIGSERVIYIRTISKVLMPSISLAIVIPPKKFLEKFIYNKYSLDPNTSGINQKILEKFILDNLFEIHLIKMRKKIKIRFEKTLSILKEIPHIDITHIPKGGFFIWIKVSEKIDVEMLRYKCKLKGVAILPEKIFYINKNNSQKIRLSFVSCSLEELEIGLTIIKNVLESWTF